MTFSFFLTKNENNKRLKRQKAFTLVNKITFYDRDFLKEKNVF